MWLRVPFHRWLSGLSCLPARQVAGKGVERRRARHRLCVEQLEDRCLLSATLVSDIAPGAAGSTPANLVNVGGELYFSADPSGAGNGTQLWKSDGIASGTVLLADRVSPTNLTNVNGRLFFEGHDATNGNELWTSNGTAAGTFMVKDIYPGTYTVINKRTNQRYTFPNSSQPSNLVSFNGSLFFTATVGPNHEELMRSDGTAAGTVTFKDIAVGSLTVANNYLFFAGQDAGGHGQLWRSDGTAAGTKPVYTFSSTLEMGPGNLTNVNGTLFFSSYHLLSGGGAVEEMWKSDGTVAGTVLLHSYPDDGGGTPYELTAAWSTLYFVANDGSHGRELWKSNGTVAGTLMVKDINPGSSESEIADLTAANGVVFFSATDGAGVTNKLWKSDGTATGTVVVKDIYPEVGTSGPYFVNANGTLYLNAADQTSGFELWRSDGTTAGTTLVQDINPGNGSSDPQDLTVVGSHLFFSANDGTHGVELWDPPVPADGEDASIPRYSILDLGTLGGQNVTPAGINNAGQVVGVSTTVTGDTHAFFWQNGHMTDLGTFGGNFSEAYIINSAGEIAGGATTAGGDEHPVIWRNGHMIDLTPHAPAGAGGWATAINDSGEAVGELYFPDGSGHAFLYDHTGLHDLHTQVTLGGSVDEFWAINNQGQITGLSATADGEAHAILYDRTGRHDLGTLAGTWSEALDINDAGQISGESGYDPTQHFLADPFQLGTDAFIHSYAFLYSNGVMHDLGAVRGASWSQGSWVDSSGRVFGGSIEFPTDPGGPADGKASATLWTHGRAIDLNSRLVNHPASLYPNNLGTVEWGNHRGQLVAWGVLAGTHPPVEFHAHGYLLTPVEGAPQSPEVQDSAGEILRLTGGTGIDPAALVATLFSSQSPANSPGLANVPADPPTSDFRQVSQTFGSVSARGMIQESKDPFYADLDGSWLAELPGDRSPLA